MHGETKLVCVCVFALAREKG